MLPLAYVTVLAVAGGAHAAWKPSATWLAQARCVHAHEGPWSANTGNGYFGGFQFAAQTWRRVGGAQVAALSHPGNAAFPFAVPVREQLYRAWRLWQHDGGTWLSWGATGAACSAALR
jgi:resuscitation-promoting factor RpfA